MKFLTITMLCVLMVGCTLVARETPPASFKVGNQDDDGTQGENAQEENKKNQDSDSTEQEEQEERIPAPDFSMTDWDGNTVKLSDFYGKPMVVNFWATWCGPCMKEMPDFNDVYKEMGEDFQFVMVDLTDGFRETPELGRKLVEDKGFEFPVFFDTEGEGNAAYQIQAIPLSVFIDAEGYIVGGHSGTMSRESLIKALEITKSVTEKE